MKNPASSTRNSNRKSARVDRSFIAALSRNLALASLAVLGLGTASARTLYWDPLTDGDGVVGGDGFWDTLSLTWDPTGLDTAGTAGDNVAWTGTTDTAVFTTIAGTVLINTGSGLSVGGLTFGVDQYNINGNSAAEVLTLTGATPTITVTNASDTATISATIAGSSGLLKLGNGKLALTGVNTFSGAIAVNAGTLAYNADAALGATTNGVTLNGGTLSDTLTTGQVVFTDLRTLTITGSNNVIDVQGVAPTGKLLLNQNVANQLIGSGNFTKTGGGDLQISKANTGFTGNVTVSGGILELQTPQSLGATPNAITMQSGGELTISGINWPGAIIAAGGAIGANAGPSTYSGPITLTGANILPIKARFFQTTTTANAVTVSGQISGSGEVLAQGPSATNTGRVILTGNNNATWTGTLQVDPLAQAVATVGFGTGGINSLPTGLLVLNGGRLSITPSIGMGLATTPGILGRWISSGSNTQQNTFAEPWFSVPTAATRIDSQINSPNEAGIDPITGLPGGFAGTNPVPQGAGLTAASAFVDSYGSLYHGLFNINTAGSYSFFITSDDGSSLFVDGLQVLTDEGAHGMAIVTGTVALTSGQHEITVKHANGGTGGGIQVAYQGPDQPVAPVSGTINTVTGYTNMAVVGLNFTNVTGGLTANLVNNISVIAPNSVLDTSGFDAVNAGTITVAAGANLNFSSATSHSFTQNGAITLAGGAGLSSAGVAVTSPVTTTLAPANVILNGTITLTGNANLNADGGVINAAAGLMTINGVISDGGFGFGITKNGGGGTVVLAGTSPNTFSGALNVGNGVVLLSKPAGVAAIGTGGVNLNTTASTGAGAVSFATVRLNNNEQILDAAPIVLNTNSNATAATSYGATLDLNNFTETVGTVSITGANLNMARIVTGATGKLTVGGDLTLTNNNPAVATGREVLITGLAVATNALNLFSPGSGELNLGGATRNITTLSSVTFAGTDSTIDTIITNGGIVKQGGQRLVLNGSDPDNARNSTFAGGITLNDGVLRGGGKGAQTDSAFGTGTLTINKGLTTANGGIAANLATLELRNNAVGVNTPQAGTLGVNFVGQAVANTVIYGNNVSLSASVPEWAVDVNDYPQLQNGATLTGSGATLALGTLTTGANAQLDVTGGNNYALRLNGLALGGALNVKPTTGNLELHNLAGAGANNIATVAGTTGSLIISGSGAGFTGNVSVATGGTLRLAPSIGVANNLFGGGTFTTATNPTIGVSATTEGGAVSGVGAIQGQLLAKFYQINAAQTLNTTTVFATVPTGTMPVNLLSDGAISNRPPTITALSFTNDVVVYTGLLNITTGGKYTFQTFVDDESQLVIDGIPVVSINTGGGGTGIIHSPVSGALALSAGFHTISYKVSNQGGAGGAGVSFNGPDSGNVMRPLPSTSLYRPTQLGNIGNAGVDQTIGAAGILTLDGGGTDLDGGINNLTFAGAGTLNVTNVSGTGAMTVSGITSFGANTPTLNPTTGVLALVGDVQGSATISKTGAGLLILAGPKTFTGLLNIAAGGGVQVTDPNSLGTAAGSTVVVSGGVLDLNGVALGAEPISLAGTGVANLTPGALWNSSSSAASASGPITLTAATTVGGFGDITLSGSITGAFALTKIGPGTLTLGNANNTGAITVSQGFLKESAANAIGATVTSITTAAGGVFDLTGFSTTRPISISGAGTTSYGSMNSLGTLVNTGASGAVLGGAITMTAASSIGSSSLGAGGDFTVNGIIGGAFALTKVGGNTVTITTNSSFTGGTTISLGGIILSGGGFIDDGGMTVDPNAFLTLDNSGTNTNLRLGARAVNLVGGSFNLIGNAGVATNETLGANNLTTTSNRSVITITPGAGGATTLSTTNALARGSNGTFLIRGTSLGSGAGSNVAVVSVGATSTVGQGGTANTHNRAILPWAAVDSSTTGDGLSFAGFGTGFNSGILTPLNPATDYDVNTIAGVNNILVNAGTLAVPTGSTLVNSLNLGTGGILNIGAGNSLQLDSGGIFATDISSITNGTLNLAVAQSNNPRELLVYTSGAGTNLTISSTITSQLPGQNTFGPNTGTNVPPAAFPLGRTGLTKDGLGTLTLSAQNTLVGSMRLNGGTTVLAGGANTMIYPATQAAVLGSLASTLTAQNLIVDAGAILDLNGNNQRFGGFASNLAAGTSALPGQGGVITNNSTTADATLYTSQNATFVVPTSLSASSVVGAKKLNFQRDGGFTLTLTSPNTYTGTTVLNGGLTVLQDGATLSGTSGITINRSVLRTDDSQTIQTLNRIPTTTPITLNGGALTFIGRGGGTQNVWNVGTATIGLGTSLFQETMSGLVNANGAGTAQLTIGNLVKGGVGSEVVFNYVQSNNQSVGDNPRYYISQLNGGSLPSFGTMLPAWITVGGYNPATAAGGTSGTINNITQNTVDFAQYDPTTGLRPVFYSSTFAPGNNVYLGATATIPVGGAVINSLHLDGAAFTVLFGDAGYDVLNLQSGGLLSGLNNTARVLGITANAGRLTAGGVNPGGPRELYVYNAANTLTLNATIENNPTDGSVVSPVFSAGGLAATIQLNGSNTYTGTTYANGVVLTLNATNGGVAIPGDLVLSGNSSNGADSQTVANQTTRLLASNQIATTSNITLNGGTLLDLNGFNNTVASLTFAADGGSNNNQGSGVQTGAGVLTLDGGITAINLSQATTIPTIQGNLSLPAGSHAVNVGIFAGAPNQVGLTLNSTLSGTGSLDKSGAGILGVGGSSPAFGGTFNINTGAVEITTNNANLGGAVNIAAGAILNAGGFMGTVGSLLGAGIVTSTFSGLAQYGGQINVGGNGSTSTFGGLVTGVVAVGKVGAGDLKLTNVANDFSGGVVVNAGTFTLAGAGLNTTGSGVLTVNNNGTLLGAGAVNGGLRFNPGSAASLALPTTPGAAPITTLASVTSNGGTSLSFTGTPGVGVYPLIDYSGSALTAGQMAGFKIGATPGGSLLYGLVNNAANTSIDLSVETVHASNTWTGATDGTWDTFGSNWVGGTYTDTNQVVFDNTGANKNISGDAVNPQAITVNNSGAGNDYTIANNLGGSLAGGLTKTGNATLRLTGTNTFGGGAITVNGGTLRASVSTASNSLGSAPVSLGNGTTLQLDPTASIAVNGLTARYFHITNTNSSLSQQDFTSPAIVTQIDANVNQTWNATNRPAGGLVGTINGGNWELFSVQWDGKVNLAAAGPWSFFTSGDDGTRLFIDGQLIFQDDGGHGNVEVGGTTNLSAGLHDLRYEYFQNGGGAVAGLSYQGPGVPKTIIPSAVLFTAENVTSTQANNNVGLGTNLNVSGAATVNLNGSAFTGVQADAITSAPGSTLNITGSTGKLLHASTTFLSGGTVTYNTVADFNPGQLTDGGAPTTIVKQGAGRLTLDNTALANTNQSNLLTAGATFDVQGGKLAVTGFNGPVGGTNPLGAAAINLNGGGLLLDTKQNSVVFDNAITVVKNATLEVLPNSDTLAATTVTVGGTNGITMQGGTNLTFDSYGGTRNNTAAQNIGIATNNAGAVLIVAGPISGTGNLRFQSTQFNTEKYPVYGTATLNANNTVSGTVTLTGGYAFQNIANPIIVTLNGQGRLAGSTGITLNQAQLTIDDSATVNTGRLNSITPVPVTLRAGTLHTLVSTTANSGETIGTLTLDSGLNRLALVNAPGTGFTGLITANNLVRNNNAAILFQGTTLGGAATVASLVKFNTSLAGQTLGGNGAIGTSTLNVLPYGAGTANPATNPPTFMPVTYDVNGIRPINTTTEITTLALSVANGNARDSIAAAASPVPTVNAINSYTLDDSTTTAQTATLTTNVLTFNGAGAGLLLATATNATQSALTLAGTGINFSSAEGNIIVTNTAGLTISAPISGTNGLTISGNNNINTNNLQTVVVGGSLTLTADNSAGLTGPITINGTLVLNNGTTDVSLGNAGNPVNFGGGKLLFNNANSLLAVTRTVTMLPNTFGVIDTNALNDTIAGPVTGSGGLVKVNTGTLTLSNAASNYSGNTTVFQGSLTTTTGPTGNYSLNSTAANTLAFAQPTDGAYTGNITGVGSVQINNTGGAPITVTLGDPNDATKGVNLYGGGTTFANANPTTLRGTTSSIVGGIATLTNDSITYEQAFDGTSGALISGSANLNKLGAGKVTLVNANTYTGPTAISGGTLSISSTNNLGNAPAGSNTISISGGATLESTGTFDLGINRTISLGTGGGKISVSSGNALTASGAISGPAGADFTKAGAGSLTLFSPNTYGGATIVNGGSLIVAFSSSIDTSSAYTIGSSATLDVSQLGLGQNVTSSQVMTNNGTVLGSVIVSGTLTGGRSNLGLATDGLHSGDLTILDGGIVSPGAVAPGTAGILAVSGQFSETSLSTIQYDLDGTTAGGVTGGYDQIVIGASGAASIAGNIQVTLGFNPSNSNPDRFTIVQNNGSLPISGTFSFGGTPLANNATFDPGGHLFRINYNGGDGNDVVLTAIVPEPGSAALLLGGLGMLAGARRKRRS